MSMKKNHKVIALGVLVSVLLGFGMLPASAATNTVVFTASGSWVAPSGVTSIQVSGWGGGGGGAGTHGSGGGGGAYAGLNSFSVTPGNSYSFVVGTGGAVNTNGGTTTFNGTSLSAAPGWSNNVTSVGGLGGAIASSTGDVLHAGGKGGIANNGDNGSGGGEAGGALADGNPGGNASGVCAGGAGGTGANTDGGDGGKGGNTTASAAGIAPGGGGGGNNGNLGSCGTNHAGSAGARGEVDITYVVPQISAAVTVGKSRVSIGKSTVLIR